MRIRSLAPAALGLILLAGCASGGGSAGAASSTTAPSNGELQRSGPQVGADAARALLSAGAATVSGTLVTADGMQQRVDLHLQDGDMTGTVGTPGGVVEVVTTGGSTAYLRAPASYWTATGLSDAAAARLGGRWVRGGTALVDELTPVSLSWLADGLRNPSGATYEAAVHRGVVDSGRLTGRPAAVVRRTDGGRVLVATSGAAYPLEVDEPGGRAGTLSLSAFSETDPIAPPSGAIDRSAIS